LGSMRSNSVLNWQKSLILQLSYEHEETNLTGT
jgi:hypothetical protein